MPTDPTDDRKKPTVYSVTEITRHIKNQLERRFVNLWIEGELSNLKRPSSGHFYFTLKDDRAQLPAVMFRSSARALRFRPEDGLAVRVWGHLTVYEPRGAYQIRVERMEPLGKGALQLAFEQLKEKLASQGLFETGRKKPLPLLPQRIGIVTSPSGAALRDLCRILYRRFDNVEVLVYPAQVQGELAAAEIAQGVRVLNRLGGLDVIVVTRGGGSLEDLWPFNEESVARAIAASHIPVVSAVGHEVDVTISDYVADLRAPTPSAAAEMVVRPKDDFRERVELLATRATRSISSTRQDLSNALERVASKRSVAAARLGVERRAQRIDELGYRSHALLMRATSDLVRRTERARQRLEAQRVDQRLRRSSVALMALTSRLDQAAIAAVGSATRALGASAGKLDALSPLAVLGRGYSLCWTAQGKLLRRAADVSVGEPIRVDLHEGRLHCRVEHERDHDDERAGSGD